MGGGAGRVPVIDQPLDRLLASRRIRGHALLLRPAGSVGGMSSGAHSGHSRRADTYVTRLMGGLFCLGAVGFVVGPLDAYAGRVGARGDAVTFFVASILFTGGGLTQSWLAFAERRTHRAGLLAWPWGLGPIGRHAPVQLHDV